MSEKEDYIYPQEMKKHKLIQYLATCDAAEWDRLRRFVASPYFNERSELLTLLDRLRSYGPGFAAGYPRKIELYAAVYPDQPFEAKTLRYLESDLSRLVERFWALETFESTADEASLALMRQLSKRGLEKGYRRQLRQWEDRFAERRPIDVEELRIAYHLAEVEEHHFENLRQRQFDPHIERVAHRLDAYYYLQRLIYTCGMLDRAAVVQGTYHIGITPEWVQHLRQAAFFDNTQIRLYHTIYLALSTEADDEHFTALKEQLRQAEADLAPGQLRTPYLFAINYCARKIRQGRQAYLTEALDLYSSGIEREVLIDENGLSPWTFTNVVRLALRLERYRWIETFIATYGPGLPDNFRDNALAYSRAELYYHTQRYGSALEALLLVAHSDLNYYLNARVMLAKIYYETDETEPLLSLLAAFMIFLKRNQSISGNLKATYLNFCDSLFQLTKGSGRRFESLESTIQQTDLLAERDWLLAQYRAAK